MKYRFKIGIITISMQEILMLVFSVFFILKMLRAFSGTTVQGGIWNYLQLFFVAVGLILFIAHFYRYVSSGFVISFLLYVLIAMLNTLFFADLSRNWIFDYLMIPYAFAILMIAFGIGRYYDIENNKILTVTYFIIAAIFITSMISNGVYSTRTGAVADVYYPMCLLPLMLICVDKLKLLPMAICGIAVLISGKRTGIIVFVLMILAYYSILIIQSRSVRVYAASFFKLAVVITLFVVAFYLINAEFNNNLLERVNRIVEKNDSSGRYERWNLIINNFSRSNVTRWIFGYGNGAVAKFFGGNAHNDFLEVLYEYGIFALAAYVSYNVFLVIEMVKMFRDRYIYAPQFTMALICSFGLSFFSFYVIAPTYITAGMLSIGLILIDYKKRCYPNSRIVQVS